MRIKKLIASLSKPHQNKASRIYEKYHGTVFYIALNILNDRSFAEDACQETFFRVIRNIDKIDENNVHATKKYLEIICRNVAIDILRKQNKISQHEIPMDDIDDFASDKDFQPPDILLNKEMIGYITKEIKNLNPIYQDVFLLKIAYGLSIEEIAKIMEISVSAAQKRYTRARSILIERLEEYRHE